MYRECVYFVANDLHLREFKALVYSFVIQPTKPKLSTTSSDFVAAHSITSISSLGLHAFPEGLCGFVRRIALTFFPASLHLIYTLSKRSVANKQRSRIKSIVDGSLIMLTRLWVQGRTNDHRWGATFPLEINRYALYSTAVHKVSVEARKIWSRD